MSQPIRNGTLRRRLAFLVVVAFVLAMSVLTAAAVARERRDLVGIHAASADSLLSHLVEMPQFQRDEAPARHEVLLLEQALRPASVLLQLAPADSPAPPLAVERLAAVAAMLSDLRARMRDPKRRALALLSDLLAGDELTPGVKHGLRAAIGALESLSRKIDGAEMQVFGRR